MPRRFRNQVEEFGILVYFVKLQNVLVLHGCNFLHFPSEYFDDLVAQALLADNLDLSQLVVGLPFASADFAMLALATC